MADEERIKMEKNRKETSASFSLRSGAGSGCDLGLGTYAWGCVCCLSERKTYFDVRAA
jgi:hypothetical protein